MSYNYQEDDIPLSFGYRQNGSHSTNPAYTHPDPVNTNHSMIDMKTVRQYKAEQARILEQFNTPYYSLLEFGAENMLSFEQLGKVVMDILSGSFISEKWKEFLHFLNTNSQNNGYSDDDTVTINKVDIIQKQLDAIVAQMERVKEENRRKSEELEMLKRTVEERNRLSNSMPLPTSPSYYQENVHSMEQVHASSHATPSDDYIMDFSKPAGYKPSAEPISTQREEPTVLRRRSLEPQLVPEMEKPPLPSNPPPRRSLSRESSQGPPPPIPPPVVQRRNSHVENQMEKQHNQLMEEIRKSVSQRKLKSNDEEKQVTHDDLEVIVKGTKDESVITKEQRQLKLSLNDEIRMRMQERLKVMKESDSEDEVNVNEMD